MKRIVFITFCLIAVSPAQKPNGNTGKHGKASNDKAQSPVTFVDNRTTAPEQKPAEQKSPHWLTTSAPAEWALFFAGAGGVIIAISTLKAINRQVREMASQREVMFGQMRAMHDTVLEMSVQTAKLDESIRVARDAAQAAQSGAEAAMKSADATRDSVEMFISKERATLRFDLKRLDLRKTPDRPSITVDFTITLHGQTSAAILESKCVAGAWPYSMIDEPELMDRIFQDINSYPAFPSFVPANGAPVDCYAFPFIGDKDGEILTQVRGDEFFVVIRGFINYEDVFGRKRETKFRYVWEYELYDPKDSLDRIGAWRKCGPEKDNAYS